MEIVKYRQFSKVEHEKILDYLNLLFKENRYEDLIELDNTFVVVAKEESDEYDDREKRVEFFPLAEEAKIAERLNEKGIDEIEVYRCTHGFLVIQFLEYEEKEDKRKERILEGITLFLFGLGPLWFLLLLGLIGYLVLF